MFLAGGWRRRLNGAVPVGFMRAHRKANSFFKKTISYSYVGVCFALSTGHAQRLSVHSVKSRIII